MVGPDINRGFLLNPAIVILTPENFALSASLCNVMITQMDRNCGEGVGFNNNKPQRKKAHNKYAPSIFSLIVKITVLNGVSVTPRTHHLWLNYRH